MALVTPHCAFSPDCPDGQWGPDCQNSCEPCANGGQCNRETGACDCPPGYTGPSCSASKSLPQPSPWKEGQIENSGCGLISAALFLCEIKHADLRLGTLHLQEFPRLDLTLFVGGRFQINVAKLHPKWMLSLDLIYGKLYLEIQRLTATTLGV